MIKDIKFNGISTVPSDYESPDGDLSVSMGLIQEEGGLREVQSPKRIFTLSAGSCLVYIHVASSYKHYITRKNGKIYYIDAEDEKHNETEIFDFVNAVTLYQVTAIGNTLILLSDTGKQYLLWKSSNSAYNLLGSKFPELPISFGLQGEYASTDTFDIDFSGTHSIYKDYLFAPFRDDQATYISNQVLGKVNKLIADQSTNAGRFVFPFFVRYAYRLYDGTLVMHSCPVLMPCANTVTPRVYGYLISEVDHYIKANLFAACISHVLDYKVDSYDGDTYLPEIKKWSDIIRSVDIFISKPIYTYDQNGECIRFARGENCPLYGLYKYGSGSNPGHYLYRNFTDGNDLSINGLNPIDELLLPGRKDTEIKDDIKSCAQFYLLNSINVDKLSTLRTKIDIGSDYLQSLLAREVMTDDYDSHAELLPSYAHIYNSRVNFAGIKKKHFKGFNIATILCHSSSFTGDPLIYGSAIKYYIHVRHDSGDIVVEGDHNGNIGHGCPMLFIYYPDTNAYKATVIATIYDGKSDPIIKQYEVPLEKHAFLNGAFYYGEWVGILTDGNEVKNGVKPVTRHPYVEIPNKIYTSEVNNPFVFPPININTVGTGNIIGICSAARPLSQGQFGQYPLYCLSTDGVWALEVSSTGAYSAKQPITRDVCINRDSITQIDNAVLFATNRGIMLLSGSESKSITDILSGEQQLDINTLPYISDVTNISGLTIGEISYQPFYTFLAQSHMIYDYLHQRIILYNPNYAYAYIYSLKSKMWGTMQSNIQNNVNSYPDALATTQSGDGTETLVDFSISDGSATHSGMFITRPLKLDAHDILKTVDTVIMRGFYRSGHVKVALYGSRNMFNWFLVASSVSDKLRGFSGSPYKYFRLVVITSAMRNDENVSGCTVQYTQRLTNKPR